MDLVARLKLFIENSGLQNSQIADMAGIPRPTLSQLLTGRNKKISNELIEKLHKAFPQLNILWLLFGDGDMTTDANIKTSELEIAPADKNISNYRTENEAYRSPSLFDEDVATVIDRKNANPVITQFSLNGADYSPTADQQMINMAKSPEKIECPRVQSIMVFYSDNSFEIFEPAKKIRP